MSARVFCSGLLFRRLAVWSLLLLICSIFEWRCGFRSLDLRASSAAGCAVRRDSGACGAPPPPLCFSVSTAALLSPRSLGAGVAAAGPLLAWLPLAAWTAWRRSIGGVAAAAARRYAPALIAAAATFLAVINVFRFGARLQGGGAGAYDASGHTLLFGLQLVPTWTLRQLLRPSLPALRVGEVWLLRAVTVVEGSLWVLSASTAAFHHSAAEVALPWAGIVLLAAFSHDAVLAERHALPMPVPPAAAAAEGADDDGAVAAAAAAVEAATPPTRAAGTTSLLSAGAAFWAASLAVSLGAAALFGVSLGAALPLHLAYDAAVLLLALGVHRVLDKH